ncbi:Na(+)/H(+) antiporter subunit D [compost metagenome]
MNNAVIFPILVPLLTGIVLVLLSRSIRWQRMVSGTSVLINAAAAILLLVETGGLGIQTLNLGGWDAPYGIVLVADRLAALLVFTAALISVSCMFYAFRSINRQREEHHFYAFFHFLMAGVNGSFLTGDLFNMFVCFELMLMSSYALIVLGGTSHQLRETLKYVLINIVSSAMFVAAIGFLYSITGTLNLAHLSVRVAEIGQEGILSVISVLLLIVFSIKAGLFLFFWLAGSYAAPPSVVTALFAGLLTKVGLYAIIRIFTLIFYHDPDLTQTVIGTMAGATMILGVIGAVSYMDVNKIMVYNVVAGVGFVAYGMASSSKIALEGLLLYLFHDMLIKTLLFLLGGALIAAAGTSNLNKMGGLIKSYPLLGWMLFVTALALAGVPPLSGFPGKLMLFEGGLEAGLYGLTIIAIVASLLMMYSIIKIFTKAFWGTPVTQKENSLYPVRPLLLSSMLLFVLIICIGPAAELIYPFVSESGTLLLKPELYINAVLKE